MENVNLFMESVYLFFSVVIYF